MLRKSSWIAAALLLACVTPPPALSSFPARAGAVWSDDCCGAPIVATKPALPAEAQRRGLTGWVVVSGILDARGWVSDPIVLAADPPGVFDQAALAAFDGWRYAAPADAKSRHEVRALISFRSTRPRGAAPGGSMEGGGGGGGSAGY